MFSSSPKKLASTIDPQDDDPMKVFWQLKQQTMPSEIETIAQEKP